VESNSVYYLGEGVQVRREKFGLLFYNYRGPRLYFVPSRDLLGEDVFDGQHTEEAVVESVCLEHGWSRQLVRQRIHQVLTLLERKGLIHEQQVC